jgi:hypothetical protein
LPDEQSCSPCSDTRPQGLAIASAGTHTCRVCPVSESVPPQLWACLASSIFLVPLGWRPRVERDRLHRTQRVGAGLSRRATEYDWSSARAHAQEDDLSGFLDLQGWKCRYDGRSWEEMLDKGAEDADLSDQLREATQRGRPCADAETITAFERRLSRTLRAQPSGRPRKRALELETQACLGFGNGE